MVRKLNRNTNAVLGVIAAAVGCFSSIAKADDTYNFSAASSNAGYTSAFGSFTSNSTGAITSVNGTATASAYTYSLGHSAFTNTFISTGTNQGTIFAVFATSGLATPSYTGGNIQIYSFTPLTSPIGSANNVYIGAYHQTSGVEDLVPSNYTGIFTATLASAGGDAGGTPSGGAPSPQLNALLGLALAGGTVAFLRRRRTKAATA